MLRLNAILDEFQNTDALLFGNGMSMAVLDDRFSYARLAQSFRESYLQSGKRYLSLAVSKRGDIINIEENLRYLDESSRLLMQVIAEGVTAPELAKLSEVRHSENEKLLFAAERLREVYLDSQKEVIRTIIASHDRYLEKNPRFEQMKNLMRRFHHIFTVNYDVIAYLAFAQLTREERNMSDLFSNTSDDQQKAFFKPQKSVKSGDGYLYYLHGGIHLFVEPNNGQTYKVRKTKDRQGIVEAIREHIDNDESVPLCVFEGTSNYKVERIESNLYLKYGLHALGSATAKKILLFGIDLAENDIHLVNAIKENPHIDKIYYGIYSDEPNIIAYTQARIKLLFNNCEKEVLFYSTNQAFI